MTDCSPKTSKNGGTMQQNCAENRLRACCAAPVGVSVFLVLLFGSRFTSQNPRRNRFQATLIKCNFCCFRGSD